MAHLDVEVVTADRLVWQGTATHLSAPAFDGQMGILPGHQPVLTVLGDGVMSITTGADKSGLVRFEISGGFFSVDLNKVVIITDRAQAVGQ